MELESSARTPHIPDDIWFHVAQFVPHSELCSMFSVNRPLFQCSMDARYHKVKFGFDSARNEASLERLRRVSDPTVSHRVCRLYIDFIYDGKFYAQFDKEGNLNPGWISTSLQQGIQILTETVSYLTNVAEFSVKWLEFPAREHLGPFLTAAWKSFGPGLQKLSFNGPLIYLATVISDADGLASLRDLEVELSLEKRLTKAHHEAPGMVIGPFINKVAPGLHGFSFRSHLPELEVTSFFHHLAEIPNLERLYLCFNNTSNILSDPSTVTRYICSHAATLRHLKWDVKAGRSIEEHSIDWLSGSNLEEVFLNLRTLLIPIPATPGGFSLVTQYLIYSTRTLTSLGLYGYYLTFEEVNTVVSLFTPHSAGNLEVLSLTVEFLSPELIMHLAQTVPHLEKLSICPMYVTEHDGGKGNALPITVTGYETGDEKDRLVAQIFEDKLRVYNMHDWPLRDVSISFASSGELELCERLMWVLADCIPSVITFRGLLKYFF